jgi:murein L,D-transpeptidase YcbB/YkuD
MKWLVIFFCLFLITIESASANPVSTLQQEYDVLEEQSFKPRTVIPDGPLLHLGIKHPNVVLLTRRINELYGTSLIEDDIFDSDLEYYVKKAQRDRSINDDGVVGPQTRNSLNIGPEESMRDIKQAINEWKTRLGDKTPWHYIVVNIPSYELIAYENDHEVFRSKVIVGSIKNKTPLMATEAFSLKFNPDWTAPSGIRRSYAAKWNSGERDYFNKNGVQVSYDKNGRLKFYQPPSSSYLGKLKIELDNPYDVYMHDTDSPRLFNKSVRALSHGCIRVQDYQELAAWLAYTTEDEIAKKISTDKTFWESVNRVPVYTMYMLAYPGSDGTIGYFKDVYNRGI